MNRDNGTPPRRTSAIAAAALAASALAYDPAASSVIVKSTCVGTIGIVAMGIAFSHARQHGPHRVGLPVAALGWLGWLGWMLLSTTWAERPAPVVTVAWASTGALALATGTLARTEARQLARHAASWVVAGSGLACALQLARGTRGFGLAGLQGNPNWLGLVVACAFPLALEQAWIDLGSPRPGAAPRRVAMPQLRRARAALLLSAGLLALGCAESRVAWTALALGALAVGWSIRFDVRTSLDRSGRPDERAARATARAALAGSGNARKPLRAGPLLAVAAAVMVTLVAASWWLAREGPDPDPPRPADRSEHAGVANGLATSWAGRLWIWRTSGALATAHLPLGVGLGDWQAAYATEQGERLQRLPPSVAATRFVHATTAHDDWLEAVGTGGPIAVLWLALTFVLGWVEHWRSWRAGAASLLVLAIAALGDSPLHLPGVLVLLGPLLGATRRVRLGPLLPFVHGLLWATTILVLPAGARAWVAERALTQAEGLAPLEREAALGAAASIDPRSATAAARLGIARIELGRPEQALGPLERSAKLVPAVGSYVAAGNALVQLGRLDEAVAKYDTALALQPGSFRARLNRAEALRMSGRLDEAVGDLEIARILQPGHPKLQLVAERIRRERLDQSVERGRAATPSGGASVDE